jgi:hypothetical protein
MQLAFLSDDTSKVAVRLSSIFYFLKCSSPNACGDRFLNLPKHHKEYFLVPMNYYLLPLKILVAILY